MTPPASNTTLVGHNSNALNNETSATKAQEEAPINLLDRIHLAIDEVTKKQKQQGTITSDKVNATGPSESSNGPTLSDASNQENSDTIEKPETHVNTLKSAATPTQLKPFLASSSDDAMVTFIKGKELLKLSHEKSNKRNKDTSSSRNALNKESSLYSKGSDISTELVQKMLSENQQMLYAIHESLKADKETDLKPLFGRLQQNLIFLAMLADQPFPVESNQKEEFPAATSQDYTNNLEFWTEEELNALYRALQKPNQDLVQLEAAVKTKSAAEIHRYLRRAAESYKSRRTSASKVRNAWSFEEGAYPYSAESEGIYDTAIQPSFSTVEGLENTQMDLAPNFVPADPSHSAEAQL